MSRSRAGRRRLGTLLYFGTSEDDPTALARWSEPVLLGDELALERARGVRSGEPELPNALGMEVAQGLFRTTSIEASVIEAIMLWNEPNNKSHWDFVDCDPDWRIFSNMAILGGACRPRGEHRACRGFWAASHRSILCS